MLLLQFWSPPRAVDVDDGQWVGRAIGVEHHGRGVHVLPQVQFEAVAVLGDVVAVGAPVLVDVRVRLEVRVEHGLVDAGVGALRALEGFGARVVAQVVLEVVFVLGHEGAARAGEHLVALDVSLAVRPEIQFGVGYERTLLALENLGLEISTFFSMQLFTTTKIAIWSMTHSCFLWIYGVSDPFFEQLR